MNMPRWTIAFGSTLILLGLFAYFVWGDQQSWTALIPSMAGALFLLLGLLGLIEKIRKHMMHLAAALSLLLILGTARSIPKLINLIQGGDVARPLAVQVQSITAVLGLIFLGLCVRSFILARRAREKN